MVKNVVKTTINKVVKKEVKKALEQVNYDEITRVSRFWDGTDKNCWVVKTPHYGEHMFFIAEDDKIYYGDISEAHNMDYQTARMHISEYGGKLVDLRKIVVV